MTRLQIALAALLGGVLVGAAGGWRVASWRCDAARVDAVSRAIEQADRIAAQDRDILTAEAQAAVRTETVFRTIDREVIRYVSLPVARRDCLDADGLRLWRAANAGEWSLSAAPPRHSLSGFAGPSLRAGGRPAGESRDGDAGLSPMQGPASDAGGMDEQ